MSVITVTDLVPGTAATSAQVNATLTSVNSATAAGQIAGSNVRVEGVDRRTFNPAANVVEGDTSASDFFENASSNAVNSAGVYAVIPLNAGAAPMVTPAAVTLPPSTSRLIVHARVRIQSVAIPAAPLPTVWVVMQSSTDGGGTWSTPLTGSTQRFAMRDTSPYSDLAGVNNVPGIAATVGMAIRVTPTGADNYLFRLAFQTTAAHLFRFSQGAITIEHLLLC